MLLFFLLHFFRTLDGRPKSILFQDMTSVLPGHPRILPVHENSLKGRLNKVQCLGYSGAEFPGQSQNLISLRRAAPHSRLFFLRAVADDSEPSNADDSSQDKDSSDIDNENTKGGLSREDLERLVGRDDASFSGVDLATLIRKKYGRSYDVQLIKKEFMGKNLLALNVMWKYMEQRSFPLTEEEYILRLDDVANTLKCWGAVSHIRNSLEKLKERPRIGKAVSIFIDMDETGGRANEWIYK